MIRNLILMSSEPGDDTCCYFKVTPGKIKKKKNGESKEKIENCVHLFTKLNTNQKIIRTNDYLRNYNGKSCFMWTASELICSPNCCLCIISEFTINFYFRKSVSGQEMELNRVAGVYINSYLVMKRIKRPSYGDNFLGYRKIKKYTSLKTI